MFRKHNKKRAFNWAEESVNNHELVPIGVLTDCSGESSTSVSEVPSSSSQIEHLAQLMCTLTENVTMISANKYSTMGSEVIPSFDPNDKTQNIRKWLVKVEELRQIHGWNDVSTAHFATSKLRGYAKTWLESLPSINFTWVQWKEKLQAAFPEEQDFSQMIDRMMKKTKRINEPIIQYYYEKLALLNMCEIFGPKAVSCIISGIPDINTQLAAKSGNYQSPEDLLKYFKTIDSSDIKEMKFIKPTIKRYKDAHYTENSRQHDSRRPKRDEYNRQIENDRRKCYGCGSRDHILTSCPKRKTSESHKRYGNIDGTLQQTKTNKQSSREMMIMEEAKQKSKKYFFDAFIENVDVKVFVDLGSECNTLQEKLLKLLKLVHDGRMTKIKGFGGGALCTLGTVRNVKVKVDCAEALTDFVIVPDEAQNVSAIIGQPFTEQENILIYKDFKTLRIYNNNHYNLPSVIDLPPRKIPFWAKEATILPPKYVGTIICTAETKGSYYFDSSTRLKENNEYCLLRCIVEVDENNECVLPIVNPTEKDIIIKTKYVFARGEKCYPEEKNVLRISDCTVNDFVESVNIGKTLHPEEKEKLISLLSDYKHCFSSTLENIGCTTAAELKIELLDDKPVTYRAYRMNPSGRQKVRDIVGELLKCDIIRESSSPFASPVLLVKKKNGEQRLCIDYRKLNEKIKSDKFPLPRIDDQLDQLQGYTYFSTLDMTSGYYQIPVEESSKHKTSFITPDGQYEFNRMPFGISTAPSIFQRMMNKILGPLRGTAAMVYLDDILVPAKDFDQGITRLEKVLQAVQKHQLTLNPSKCNFFQTLISYLGFEIDCNGIRPGLEKTKCVKEFPTPSNVHNVRQFLGLTGFFRQFIKDYAVLSQPLTKLLRKEQKWTWTDNEQRAFEKLKQHLAERPILAIYNPQAETEVHTDASKVGLAGILLQKGIDGKQRAVAYYSRKTSAAEEIYHSYELETLAVVESLKKFRVYLLDIKFKVVTDCSAIRTAATKRDLIPRIARWWLILQEFTFEVEHRPGNKMTHVDALSRNPIDCNCPPIEELQVFRIEVADWILASQISDEKINLIKQILEKKPTTDYEKAIHKDYKIEKERIYRVTEKGLRWLVPKGMRNEIVKASHDDFGHFALEKTLRKICENYWFPNMRKYVQRYINSCIRCLYHKQPAGKQQGFLHPIEKVTIPFDTIHMDHLGPFVRTTSGKKYLVVCVEAFTKYTMLYPSKDTTTQPVLRFLDQIINQFGVPRRIVTDKGSCYTSRAFKSYCQEKGIIHIQNAVATPRANGQVERFNSTILSALATTVKEDVKWDREINKIQFALNNSKHTITKKTPSELLFGYRPRTPADAQLTNLVEPPDLSQENLEEERLKVSQRIKESQAKQKERVDKKRISPKRYNDGELVLVRKKISSDGQSKKLLPKYKGPFRVIKRLPNDRYVLKEMSGSTRSARAPYENVESVEHLKKWIPPGGKSDSEDEENNDPMDE